MVRSDSETGDGTHRVQQRRCRLPHPPATMFAPLPRGRLTEPGGKLIHPWYPRAHTHPVYSHVHERHSVTGSARCRASSFYRVSVTTNQRFDGSLYPVGNGDSRSAAVSDRLILVS